MLRLNSKPVWLAMTALLAVGSGWMANLAAAPVEVELNGLCDLLGDRRAILVLSPEASAQNITLVEGESFGVIKLIAVDMAAKCVRIKNDGRVETLRLCGTPSLSSFADTSGKANRLFAQGLDGLVENPGADGLVAEISPGNPGWGTLPLIAGGNSGAQRPNNATGQPPTPSAVAGDAPQATDPVSSLKSQADTQWYQESESIEQNRRDTAAQVLAGEMEPWPRTPLTPAGTPPALVGAGMFFSNHVPRYVVTGSLN